MLIDSASTIGADTGSVNGCGGDGISLDVASEVITTAVLQPAAINASSQAISLSSDPVGTPGVLDVNIATNIQSAGSTAIDADAKEMGELYLRVTNTSIDGYPSSSLAIDLYCTDSSRCAASIDGSTIGNAVTALGGARFRARTNARLDLRFTGNTLTNIATVSSSIGAI